MSTQNQNNPIINLPNLYKYGLAVSNNGIPNKLLKISAGICRDSNNVIDIEVGAAQNVEGYPDTAAPINLNGGVVGANGLDKGTLAASTMYAIYVIADSRYYMPTSGLISLASNASPFLPAGYDSYRLIGYWGTTSSTVFADGKIIGLANDLTYWFNGTTYAVLTAGNATTATNISLSAYVPPLSDCLVTLVSSFVPTAATTSYYRVESPSNSTSFDFFQYGQVATVPIGCQIVVDAQPISNAATIKYQVAVGTDALTLWINGYSYSV